VRPGRGEPDEFPVGVPDVGATVTRELVGQIHAVRHAEFRAHHRGIVEQLAVDEGAEVREGELMFAISAKELEAEHAQAEAAIASATAELKAAQVDADSTRLLLKNRIASKPELQLAEAKVAALVARVRETKAQAEAAAVRLSFARIHAPFDGVVNRLPHKVGSLVLEDELLTTLADTSEVFVYFRISEQDYLDHVAEAGSRRAGRVGLRLANGEIYPHTGSIDAIEGEFDTETGTIAFRARFPNPARLLKHGATGEVVIEREVPDAIVIPQSATFEIQQNVYVYTVDADDVVHATRVVPDARVGRTFVLQSGLSPSDRIVLEGAQRLKDGDRIVPRTVESDAS
jgi:RND family efflux transporter MFP subunit